MKTASVQIQVLVTLQAARGLADRIRRAYLRRRPDWRPTESDAGLWAAAASMLAQAHQEDPRVPLDPELFVAAQPAHSAIADAWGELTQRSSIRRYRRRVFNIVRQLRRELLVEIRQAEQRVGRGEALERVLRTRRRTLSPLGRLIVAARAGRPDLGYPHRDPAREQHRCCPLYRLACRGLLEPHTYPGPDDADSGPPEVRIEPLPYYRLN